jgi:Flp pilus assembly pilin Flp
MHNLYEHVSVAVGRMLTLKLEDLKREEGQGATEYAMVIGFVIVGLTITLGLLGVSIQNFLTRVATKVNGLVP